MILPLLILVPAALAAGFVAYGIHPLWAKYPHGIEVILQARRLQWPLVALVLLLCIGLLVLILSGKRRVWWLIGLAPILALLAHRFVLDPNTAYAVNARPQFVSPARASFLADDDWIVGVVHNAQAWAYPFAALYTDPVVVQSDQAKPVVLLWSPFANCARAFHVDISIHGRDLEVVSMPANTLLVYNTRLGQFINGVTGLTMDGKKPRGFGPSVAAIKTTWKQWLAAHPDTKVMVPPRAFAGPRSAVRPYYPMPPWKSNLPDDTPVALLPAGADFAAAAVLDGQIGTQPVNFSHPDVLLLRDPRTNAVRAFDRGVEDLFPAFDAKTFPKFPLATMADTDSGSAWTSTGLAIDGPLKGKQLKAIDVTDGVYYRVMLFWHADLKLLTPLPPPVVKSDNPAPPRRRPRG